MLSAVLGRDISVDCLLSWVGTSTVLIVCCPGKGHQQCCLLSYVGTSIVLSAVLGRDISVDCLLSWEGTSTVLSAVLCRDINSVVCCPG